MQNQNKTLVLSSLFVTSLISTTGFADWKTQCGRIPTMRAQIANIETRNADLERLLSISGLNIHVMNAASQAQLDEMKVQLESMETLCKSAKASSETFVGGLRGYEAMSFYKRLSDVLSGYAKVDAQALGIDEHAQAGLLQASKQFMLESLGALALVFEKDETKKAAMLFNLRKGADDMTLAVIETLKVDTKDVEDVDTLFARIHARLQQVKTSDEL